MQETLSLRFRIDETMHIKIITAYKCVKACKMAYYRPSCVVLELICDLRSGIEVFDKLLLKSDISSHQQQRNLNLIRDYT